MEYTYSTKQFKRLVAEFCLRARRAHGRTDYVWTEYKYTGLRGEKERTLISMIHELVYDIHDVIDPLMLDEDDYIALDEGIEYHIQGLMRRVDSNLRLIETWALDKVEYETELVQLDLLFDNLTALKVFLDIKEMNEWKK